MGPGWDECNMDLIGQTNNANNQQLWWLIACVLAIRHMPLPMAGVLQKGFVALKQSKTKQMTTALRVSDWCVAMCLSARGHPPAPPQNGPFRLCNENCKHTLPL